MTADDNLFPTLEPATYAALKDSIEQFGVLVPVAKDQDGKLIDGYHRSKIADELGVDFRVDVIKVESDEQRDEIAAALNLYRRHLNVAERQEQVIFLRSKGHSLRAIADAVGVDAKTVRNDLSGGELSPRETPDGKVLGRDGKRYDAKRPTVISANTQADGKKAQAVAEGFNLADGGAIDFKAASNRVHAVADAARKVKSDKLRAGLQFVDDGAQRGSYALRHGDYRDYVGELEAATVSLVLTDPPYGVGYKSGYRWATEHDKIINDDDPVEAANLVANAITALLPSLTEDAHVLVFCRWKEEPQLRAALVGLGDLVLRGSLVWIKKTHGMGDLKRTFGPAHERILHFSRPAATMRIREQDAIEASRVISADHSTEKPIELLARLIKAVTEPADLVVDPFAGTASTLRAARETGRDGWGCEINDRHFETAQRLLNAA